MNKSLIPRLWPRSQNTPVVVPALPGPVAPAGVQFIRGEDVLLLAVALPKMSAAQRRASVAFAVEDHIARPLDEVLVTLGPQLPDNRWLVGVVARAAVPAPAKPGLRLVPDTMALPIPPEGAWSVYQAGSRILIRLPDGTGFVTSPQALTVLHQIAGAPLITLYSGQIDLPHTLATLPPVVVPVPFDLADRQGHGLKVPPVARKLLVVAGLAAISHLAILTTDILGLQRQQASLEVDLRAAAGAAAEQPIDMLLTRVLSPRPEAERSGFLDLLSATFAAAAPQSGQISVRDLRYAAAQNSLTLTLQAAELGTLQQMETGLLAAGLGVQSGPATSAGGTAEQQLTLQGPPT